jgi:hypothetical protein
MNRRAFATAVMGLLMVRPKARLTDTEFCREWARITMRDLCGWVNRREAEFPDGAVRGVTIPRRDFERIRVATEILSSTTHGYRPDLLVETFGVTELNRTITDI